MAINKKLIHFKSKNSFEEKLANNEILDTSIVFIQDTKEIWTHGQLYNSIDEVKEALDNKADKSDIVVPDWNATINENGYIENKPYGIRYEFDSGEFDPKKHHSLSSYNLSTFETIYDDNGDFLGIRKGFETVDWLEDVVVNIYHGPNYGIEVGEYVTCSYVPGWGYKIPAADELYYYIDCVDSEDYNYKYLTIKVDSPYNDWLFPYSLNADNVWLVYDYSDEFLRIKHLNEQFIPDSIARQDDLNELREETTALWESVENIEFPVPDWKAQKGKPGYIANKPFNEPVHVVIPDTHQHTFHLAKEKTILYILCEGSKYTLHPNVPDSYQLECDDSEHFFEFEWDGNGTLQIAETLAEESLRGLIEITQEKGALNTNLIPNTVLKTTPQTLSNDEKNQVKANLGIPTFPTSLPANGGNADTVDGMHAYEFAPANNVYSKTEVDNKIAGIVDGAPEALNTLNELAEALRDNKDIVTVLENSIGSKQDKTTAITTSNIGEQSVAYADNAGYATNSGNASTLSNKSVDYFVGQHYDTNNINVNSIETNHITHAYNWSNTPVSSIGSLVDISYSADWKSQLFFVPSVQKIYSRNRYDGTTWSEWKTIAFTSDIPSIPTSLPANGGHADTATTATTAGSANSATTATTASKLSTVSKTAWGQTYWTSGGVPTNISGSISDVTDITMSGAVKMGSGAASISYDSNEKCIKFNF